MWGVNGSLLNVSTVSTRVLGIDLMDLTPKNDVFVKNQKMTWDAQHPAAVILAMRTMMIQQLIFTGESFLGGSADKLSTPGEALISSPSSPISNGSIKLTWRKKYQYLSKMSRNHLTLRMWLLLLHHNFAIRVSTGYYRVGHSPLLLYYELLLLSKDIVIQRGNTTESLLQCLKWLF